MFYSSVSHPEIDVLCGFKSPKQTFVLDWIPTHYQKHGETTNLSKHHLLQIILQLGKCELFDGIFVGATCFVLFFFH